METPTDIHPIFLLAMTLPEPWRTHFAKSDSEVAAWQPWIARHALAPDVLAVRTTRIDCAWKAYVMAVPGKNHDEEWHEVLDHGTPLSETVARVLFPEMPAELPYAR